MDRTLFVLPLEDRFKCQAHKGVLHEPVRSECGHNFCAGCAQKTAVCPVDGTPVSSKAQPKPEITSDINELLCYCKYGVGVNNNGQLIADPKGCDHIIKFGNKAAHEAVCEFRDDFIMIDKSDEAQATDQSGTESQSAPSKGSSLLPCANKDDGCFFLAESEEELRSHLNNECPYERLRGLLRQSEARVQILERELHQRNEEIAQLRAQLSNEGGSNFARRTVDGGRELIEELLRVFEEQVPHGFSVAKDRLSPAFDKTTTTISSLKSSVIKKTGQVTRGLSDVHPLEKLADISQKPLNKLADVHPIDRLIALLSSLKNGIVTAVHDPSTDSNNNNNDTDANNNNINNSNNNNNNTLTPLPADLGVSGEFEDEDTKKQIAASLATFEAEQHARMSLDEKEAAAIAAAAALSLAEK